MKNFVFKMAFIQIEIMVEIQIDLILTVNKQIEQMAGKQKELLEIKQIERTLKMIKYKKKEFFIQKNIKIKHYKVYIVFIIIY